MFQTREAHGFTVITVGDTLDASNAEEAKEFFRQLITSGRTRMVVDLSGLGFIDSSGLGALVTALKTARSSGGEVRLCCLTPQVRSIFQLTRLDKVFTIRDRLEDALS